jgi:SNF2 family DNA or RNA helicase
MESLSRKKTARLDLVNIKAPNLYAAIMARPYQCVGAKFIANNSASLIADDPGLGKTLIALAGIVESDVAGPYLVVAPKTATTSVWQREITRWLPKHYRAVTLPELRDNRSRLLNSLVYDETLWLIVNPEALAYQDWYECAVCSTRTKATTKQQRDLICGHVKDRKTRRVGETNYPIIFDQQWGAIVVDESHDCLIRRSSTPTQRRRGLDRLRLRNDGLRIAMSGTPFNSKPNQLWGTLNWLDPLNYKAYHRWSELYWQKGGYTGYNIGELRKDRERLLWDSLASVALRRTKSEVAKDLPPKMEVGSLLDPTDSDSPIGIWLPMTAAQANAYNSVLKNSVVELESGRLETITALAELTRLKQLASAYGDIKLSRMANGSMRQRYIPQLPSNKYNWIIEHLEEWGFPKPDTKVVIVSFFTGILELFREGVEKHFKTRKNAPLCTSITGTTPMRDRDRIINRFNTSGNEQVMFLNVKAGGTAITLDTADRMIFVSETAIPDQQRQAEDRIHRVSNPRKCMYYYLRSLHSVDVGTALYNKQALADTHRLLDTRRGIDYVRTVLNLSDSDSRGQE